MMDATHEHYRLYVYAETKRGQKPQQILQQLRAAFGVSAPAQSFVYRWFKDFKCGNRKSVRHLPHPGRPISKRTFQKFTITSLRTQKQQWET